MKNKIKIQLDKGFILFITLMMLIIFAILGIGLYQQTTMSTLNVQYVTFKQEAEDLALIALNELEENIKSRKSESWAECIKKDKPSEKEQLLCDQLPEMMINAALSDLKEGKAPAAYLADDQFKWRKLDRKGTFSTDGVIYYVIQQLGKDAAGANGANIGYLLYRITIISQVLDTYSVISAVTAVPEQDEVKP